MKLKFSQVQDISFHVKKTVPFISYPSPFAAQFT